MASCHGNGADHCCYVPDSPVKDAAGNGVCQFLEVDTAPGRRWSCGLFNQLGSWEAVHADPDYLTEVRPVWDRYGVVDCGDWRTEGQCCFGRNNPPVFNVEE